MKKKTKSIKISEELHRQLKVEAVERGITLQELAEQKLNDTRTTKT